MEDFELNLNNKNLRDVDIKYLIFMYWDKMRKLKKLSLNLENNKVGNKGLLKLIANIDSM